MSGFDPYLVWLDIPLHERPPTYYRLLGLRPLEDNPQTIASSAQRVIAHVSQFQKSDHAVACTQLLSELTAARDCLLNPGRKQAYDSGISQSMSTSAGPIPTQPFAGASGGLPTNPEQPLPGPAGSTPTHGTGETPLSSVPNIPTTSSERQIAQTPPVPQSVAPQPSVPQATSPRIASPSAPGASLPTNPGRVNTPTAEQSLTTPSGAPQSVQPMGTPQPQPTTSPQDASLATGSMPTVVPQQPPPTQPPAWAAAERTGQVATVVAGQPASQSPSGERTQKARKLRKAQQTQSAYMLVGIAMALIVFFFGAVLLLAIFLGGQ